MLCYSFRKFCVSAIYPEVKKVIHSCDRKSILYMNVFKHSVSLFTTAITYKNLILPPGLMALQRPVHRFYFNKTKFVFLPCPFPFHALNGMCYDVSKGYFFCSFPCSTGHSASAFSLSLSPLFGAEVHYLFVICFIVDVVKKENEKKNST